MTPEIPTIPADERLKASLEERFSNASTPEEKKNILLQLIRALRTVIESSQQAVDEANKTGGAVVPPHAQSEKENAASPLIQLFHYLTKNSGAPIDEQVFNDAVTEAHLNDAQVSFLKNIANPRTNLNTAAFLSGIAGKALEDGEYLKVSVQGGAKTELEQDFERIKRNPAAVNSFRKGLLKLVEEGRLQDSTGNAVTAEMIEQKFPVAKSSEDPTRMSEAMELQEKSLQLTQRIEGALGTQRNQLRTNEKAKLAEKDTIRKNGAMSVGDKREQLEEKDSEIASISTEIMKLEANIDAVETYLRFGDVAPQFEDEAAIREYIRTEIGMTEDEINRAQAQMRAFADMLADEMPVDERFSAYSSVINKVTRMLTKEEIMRRIWNSEEKSLDMEALKELQEELEDAVSVLFEPLYSSPKAEFNEVFSPYVEGQALKTITTSIRTRIEGVTKAIEKDLQTGGLSAKDASMHSREIRDNILKDRLVGELERRQSIERIVHQYQQQGSQIEIDKLIEIVRTYDITTLQEFYKDETTLILSDLLPQFVQQLHIENGNEVLTNLFQIVQDDKNIQTKFTGEGNTNTEVKRFVIKYRDQFIDYAYDIMMDLYKSGAITKEPKKQRIEARFSRAFLDNFLLSLRSIKVASNALPMRGGFDDIPFWHIIKGVFNPQHNWGKLGLRGRGIKGEGDAETSEVAGMRNFIYDEEGYVTKWKPNAGHLYKDYHPKEEMKIAALRILNNIYPDRKELDEDLQSGRWDYMQTMLEVYKGMVFGNIVDQGGWPFKGFESERDSLMKDIQTYFENTQDWDNLSWEDKFQLYYRTAGVVPAFWLVGARAGGDAKDRFVQFLTDVNPAGLTPEQVKHERNRRINAMGSDGYQKKFEEYTDGNKRFDKIFDVKVDGEDRKVSLRDYTYKRMQSLRGEVFHQLLLKDPQAWLGEMVQHYPELGKGYVEYTRADGETGPRTRASEFYFGNSVRDEDLDAKEREKRNNFRFHVLTQFRGKESDRYSNVPHLKKIMDFYSDIEDAYTGREVDGKSLSGSDARNKGTRDLGKQLAYARRRAVSNKQPEINKNDVRIRKEDGTTDDTFYNLLYSQDGLVTHFEEMVGNREEYFGNGEDNLGEEFGFYQRWGRWEMTNRRVFPEGDTNMELLTDKIENKAALERRLATDKAFIEGQAVFDKIPSVCDKASQAENFEQWYGIIQEGIHDPLKVISDEDQMHEQQYQFQAFIAVCNYFMKDSDTNAFLLGFINTYKKDKDLAISTIKADTQHKFVLNMERIFMYMKKLRESRYLKSGFSSMGGWGLKTAELASGVDFSTVVMTHLGYVAIATPILIALATAKEAYSEQVEED